MCGADEGARPESDSAYSAKITGYPIKGLGLVPSVQHQNIAGGEASYTSVDMGLFWEFKGWHIEAEYLRKFYSNNVFDDCSAVNAMVIYKHKIKKEKCFIESLSYMGRYDYMQDHSSGKKGFVKDDEGNPTSRLAVTNAERHRMTLGVNIGIRNPYFLTAIRVNYEKYWYPHEGANEYEQDKLVCELVIGF